jgi:hypothetical protein
VRLFSACQIGVGQNLRNRLCIALFERGRKAADRCGFVRHPRRFLEKFSRAARRCAGKMAFEIGKLRRQAEFQTSGIYRLRGRSGGGLAFPCALGDSR